MHQKKPLDFDEITKLVNAPLKNGDNWYLLDKKWYEMCKTFHESGDKSSFPGAIDNSALFQPITATKTNGITPSSSTPSPPPPPPTPPSNPSLHGKFKSPVVDAVSVDSRPLRSDLNEAEGHFILVPEKCWNLLKNAYGITSENHTIKRRVIEHTPSWPIVEIHPLSLKLCLYGGKEATVERSFSRMTALEELEQEMRKVFSVTNDRETKLWVNSAVYTFKPGGGLCPNQATKSENNVETSSTPPTLASVGVSEPAVVTLEVINADGTWPSSRPRYGTVSTRSSKAQPGLCGLSNMGNTCFMNAALQCLSNTPPLTNYILTDKFIEDINPSNPLGMHGEIARTYAELVKVMWSGNNTSFLPREFKCAVSKFAPQFNGFAQQDCQELMAFLLDGLHEDLNRIRNKPYIQIKNDVESRPDDVVAEESWSNYKKRNDSIVVDTFHAMLKSTLVCPGCELVSVTFDPFCYLSLPLPVKREKQVSLTFIPKPGRVDELKIKTALNVLSINEIKTIKQCGGSISSFTGIIEEQAGYSALTNRPKSCKMQVPRSGPASEICDIVSRIINEESSGQAEIIKRDNLVVAELSTDGRISKVYESHEHYNQMGDDIVVVEKASKYVLPLYVRERKKKNSSIGTVIGKLLFLHIPDLKFETLYKCTIASLSNLIEDIKPSENWIKLDASAENLQADSESNNYMDCDDDDSSAMGDLSSDGDDKSDVKTNGNSHEKENINSENAFDLCIVNSFGSHSFETLGANKKECDYSSKLYLGATFDSTTLLLPQFAHLRQPRYGETVEGFTPRVCPKPTLQLKDCITQFTNVERLGADDPWYCPRCKKHQQATKKFDIWSLPKVLIIHLKRFSFSRSWRDKIDTLVEFPVEDLDMSKYVLNPDQKKKYNLIGVANHFGGLGGGHYTAYAKNTLQDAWYSFDDAMVSQTTSNNVVTRSAYVLFYQLQEEEDQKV